MTNPITILLTWSDFDLFNHQIKFQLLFAQYNTDLACKWAKPQMMKRPHGNTTLDQKIESVKGGLRPSYGIT